MAGEPAADMERPHRSILLVSAILGAVWTAVFVLAMWRVSFTLTIALIVAPAFGLAAYALFDALRSDDTDHR